MPKAVRVEFRTKANEFHTTVQQVLVNLENDQAKEIAELEISAGTMEMRSIGSESAVDGIGSERGIVRLPAVVLGKLGDLAKSFRKVAITLRFEDGAVFVETSKVSHQDIAITLKPSKISAIPVNASVLEVLATVKVLQKRGEIDDPLSHPRVKKAAEGKLDAINKAASVLHVFRVSGDELLQLVNKHIDAEADVIEQTLARE